MDFEYFKKQNSGMDRSKKPKWSEFDCIWCISRADRCKSRKDMTEFFDSVGISDSGKLHWKYVSTSVFDQILFDFTKKNLRRNECASIERMSAAMSHFECIRNSLDMGHDRILIVEDSAKFTDDVSEIAKTVNNMPHDADFVNFGVCSDGITEDERKSLFCGERTNGLFVEYDKLGGSICYMLNRKAMEFAVTAFQSIIKDFDRYFHDDFVGNGLKCYMPIAPICRLNNL